MRLAATAAQQHPHGPRATGRMATAHGASYEFYGDSDAGSQVEDSEDENPFLEVPERAGKPSVEHSVRGEHGGAQQAQPAATFAHGEFQASTSDENPATSFPTITGSGITSYGDMTSFLNRGGATHTRNDTDVTMSEVETEGETENEDSGSEGERGGAGGRGNPPSATKADWSNNSEEDWVNLIEQQLKNAAAGRPDAHAMRQVLRKAGFIPEFMRKDVWRLLILGRVDAVAADGTGAGDVLALDVAILSTELDLDNQRVVRVDVERTRPALDQFKRPRVKNMLARVLTHHCKTHGLGYKQASRLPPLCAWSLQIKTCTSWLLLMIKRSPIPPVISVSLELGKSRSKVKRRCHLAFICLRLLTLLL